MFSLAVLMILMPTPARGVVPDVLHCLYNPATHVNTPKIMTNIGTVARNTIFEIIETGLSTGILYQGLSQNGRIATSNLYVGQTELKRKVTPVPRFSNDASIVLVCATEQTQNTQLRNTQNIRERLIHVYDAFLKLKHTLIAIATHPNDPHSTEYLVKLHSTYTLAENDIYTITDDPTAFGDYMIIETQLGKPGDIIEIKIYSGAILVYKCSNEFRTFQRQNYFLKKTPVEYGWRLSAEGMAQSFDRQDIDKTLYALAMCGKWLGALFVSNISKDDIIFTKQPTPILTDLFEPKPQTAHLKVFVRENDSTILDVIVIGCAVDNEEWDYEFNMTGLGRLNDIRKNCKFAVARTLNFCNDYNDWDDVYIQEHHYTWRVVKYSVLDMEIYEVGANAELRFMSDSVKLTKNQANSLVEYIWDGVQSSYVKHYFSEEEMKKAPKKIKLTTRNSSELLEYKKVVEIFNNRYDIYFMQVAENILADESRSVAPDQRILYVDNENNMLLWQTGVQCPVINSTAAGFEIITPSGPPNALAHIFQNSVEAKKLKCYISKHAGDINGDIVPVTVTITPQCHSVVDCERNRVFQGTITESNFQEHGENLQFKPFCFNCFITKRNEEPCKRQKLS